MPSLALRANSFQKYLIMVVLCLWLSNAFGQKQLGDYQGAVKSYHLTHDSTFLDSLRLHYGLLKDYPDSIELPILIALAHYPELKATRIKVKYNKGKIAHTSRPRFYSVMIPFIRKRYLITISRQVEAGLEASMYQNLSYNARIGVMGHELAHTAYYEQKSKLSILWMGMRYFGKSYKTEFENDTDRRTIRHGLGYQLLQWSKEVHDTHIKDGRGEMYLSPQEIRDYMKVSTVIAE